MTVYLTREDLEVNAAVARIKLTGPRLEARLAELREQWKTASYAGHCDHLTVVRYGPRKGATLASVADECVRCGFGQPEGSYGCE